MTHRELIKTIDYISESEVKVLTVLEWVYVICIVVGLIGFLLYAFLEHWYNNKLKTVAIDGQVFENVKCEVNEHCNEVTIIYPDTNRRVTLVYEEFEILKD